MAKPGPKRKEIDLKQVESAAARGLGKVDIARALGIGHNTFFMRMAEEREEPTQEIQEAINRGRSRGLMQVTNSLFQLATEGNLGACCFYLKNRDPDNWKDRVETVTKHIMETPAEQRARMLIENIKQVN